jgi:hypothetical protein
LSTYCVDHVLQFQVHHISGSYYWFHTSFSLSFRLCTRWFKYDRDWFFFLKNHNYQTLTCTCQVWLVYKKISPGHIWTTLYFCRQLVCWIHFGLMFSLLSLGSLLMPCFTLVSLESQYALLLGINYSYWCQELEHIDF